MWQYYLHLWWYFFLIRDCFCHSFVWFSFWWSNEACRECNYLSSHLCGKDVLSSVILDCKQIIIFGYLGLQANNYLCLSRIAKLRTDFSILSPWCTLHECLRRRRCTALILHDRVFSPLSFLEFSRFPLCRGAHINSGAGGAKWCRERSTACFLIFTLFLIFCSFRPFLHTCPAMPCHLRLSSNLLFCALDNRNFKMKQKNIKEMKRKSCGPTIFNFWRGLASHGPFVNYSKNPSAKRKGLNFSCSAVKRQMTANKRV